MREILMRTFKLTSRLAVAAAVVLVAASLSMQIAQAAPSSCGYTSGSGVYSPSGTYGGAWTGSLDGQNYDAVMLGTFSYSNPNATFSGTLVYSMAGSAGAQTSVTGTWTIAAACTGALAVSSPAGLSFTTYFNPGLGTIQLAESDGYGEMAATLTQLSTTTCSTSTIAGNWGGNWSGVLSGQQYNAVMLSSFTSSGTTYSGALTYNLVGGGSNTVTETGTYTMGGNCIGTLTLNSGNTFAVLVNSGNQVSIAETDGAGLMAHNEVVQAF